MTKQLVPSSNKIDANVCIMVHYCDRGPSESEPFDGHTDPIAAIPVPVNYHIGHLTYE